MIKYFVFALALCAASSSLAQQKKPCTDDCPAPYNAYYGSYYVTKEDREKRAFEQRIVDDFVKHGGKLNSSSSSFDPLPKVDTEQETAKAIREQTESQSRDAYLARQQMEYQQEETSRLTGAIQSQTMLGYPRY